MENDSLPALVQALPSELYNYILELTFTASDSTREISKNYKPTKLLRINRTTRELFAKSYYGQGSIFNVPTAFLVMFLRSLPDNHTSQIAEIRIPRSRPKSPGVRSMMTRLRYILRLLVSGDAIIPDSLTDPAVQRKVFKMNILRPNGSMDWVNLEQAEEMMMRGQPQALRNIKADNFKTLLEGLPTELYDQIYTLTFTASANPRTIEANYKPPVLLGIDRATRDIFARSYYGQGSIFYVPDELLMKFLKSLPKAHYPYFDEIRIVEPQLLSPLGVPLLAAQTRRTMQLSAVLRSNMARGFMRPSIPQAVFKMRMIRPDGTGEWVSLPGVMEWLSHN